MSPTNYLLHNMKTKVASLVIGALFAGFISACAQNQTQTPLRLVTVSGTGEVKVKPNEAVINLGVESRSKNLDEARKQTDEKVRDVIKVLKNNGVDQKDIQTTYLNLFPD